MSTQIFPTTARSRPGGGHGLSTKEGAELDLGGTCYTSFGEDGEIYVSAYYDIMYGPDIVETSIGVMFGNFEVTSTYFSWEYEDAFRVVSSYTLEPTEKLSVGPMLVYETGFDAPDIIGGGLKGEYALNDNISLVGTALTPIFRGDDRQTEVLVGINFHY